MISIKNLRKEHPAAPYDIIVDRRHILGNPYLMQNQTDEERIRVCKKYHDYIIALYNRNPIIRKAFHELLTIYKKHGQLNLYCWCAPKRCHAQTIKQIIEYLLNKGE